MSSHNLLRSGKAAAVLLLPCAAPVTAAAENNTPPPPRVLQQLRDAELRQLQSRASEAEIRAEQAERRERDAQLEKLTDQVKQAQNRASTEEQLKLAAQRELFIQQAKAELQNNAYSRLEIITSVSIAFFGILITIIVLIITLRTERAAIAAGRKGIEEIQEQAKESVAEIEKKREEAEAHLTEIRENKIKSDEMRQTQEKSYASASASFSNEVPKSKEDRKTVADSAQEARAKLPRDRTANEFRAIIIDALTEKNWFEMLKAAQQVQLLHEGDDDFAFARFSEAYALGEWGRHEDAITVYGDVIARYGAATEAGLREQVARALVNKGVTLSQLGRHKEEIAVYEKVIKD
ncbi:MAG: hypothetical protein EXR08_04125 [Alphaproteobacteria bacterium]|nr:hypothetical protein [Alphaproteobacteria bacterium]